MPEDHAKLSEAGHCARQTPVRYSGAHPALNDQRERHHRLRMAPLFFVLCSRECCRCGCIIVKRVFVRFRKLSRKLLARPEILILAFRIGRARRSVARRWRPFSQFQTNAIGARRSTPSDAPYHHGKKKRASELALLPLSSRPVPSVGCCPECLCRPLGSTPSRCSHLQRWSRCSIRQWFRTTRLRSCSRRALRLCQCRETEIAID